MTKTSSMTMWVVTILLISVYFFPLWVISLEAPEDEVVERILARGRSDDTEESVRNRIAVYHEQTAPLIAFYEERGIVAPVDGVGGIDEILARIVAVLSDTQ